ncbi:MAG: hypothetical protein HY826_12080 [Actinobacteria bacterium]|nr:hypothetical protein [Actinomycetota bacterium]
MRIRFHRPNLKLLLVSFVIALCLVAIGFALSLAVTGDEGAHLPAVIERVEPVTGATQTPAQTSIVVDLESGYEGVLIIDGLELATVNLNELRDVTTPGQQVTLPPTTVYEPGNATLTFDPSPGSAITEFSQGRHVVKVIYWPTTDGRASASSYIWSFEVF